MLLLCPRRLFRYRLDVSAVPALEAWIFVEEDGKPIPDSADEEQREGNDEKRPKEKADEHEQASRTSKHLENEEDRIFAHLAVHFETFAVVTLNLGHMRCCGFTT